MKNLIPALTLLSVLALAGCEKKAPEPKPVQNQVTIESTTASSTSANEFTVTGDGYSNVLAEMDTTIQVANSSYAHAYHDSLQIGIVGATTMNGVTQNLTVGISTHYTGLKSYTIGGSDFTNVGIYFLGGSPGSYYSSKSYQAISGIVTIDKADVNGFVEGSYSGIFMVDNNPANLVTITNGKFATYLGL